MSIYDFIFLFKVIYFGVLSLFINYYSMLADSPTTSVPGVSGQEGDNDNSSTVVIVAACLAAVLLVVLIVLAVVLLLRRKKRRGHGKGMLI